MQKYVYNPYKSEYKKFFQDEVDILKKVLPADTNFEHIGSTSIPGLGGKGFIDILIGVTKDYIENSKLALEKIGYGFEPEASTDTRLYFDRYFEEPSGKPSMYHIHLTTLGSRDWIEMRAFRDYLINNTSARDEYAEIKKHAVKIANQDRQIYVDTKTPVILKLIKESLKFPNKN